MSRILEWFFVPYVEDDYSAYRHSGVGYTGFSYSFRAELPARFKHSGVGYTGVYDE